MKKASSHRMWQVCPLVLSAAGMGLLASCSATAPRQSLIAPATEPVVANPPAPINLFDGKTLAGWTVTDFAGHGEPSAANGCITLPAGETLTGVNYTGKIPRTNYEVELDAQRVEGSDFFLGLTFPVGDSCASLILGGWGGGVCGISCIDDDDAARNETTTYRRFDKGVWYHVRLRVEPDQIKAWVDDQNIVAVKIAGRKISVRSEVVPSQPFGLASYQTAAAIRNIQIHPLSPE
jgi:Domain of Unknown Function (DUF1080)